MHDHSHHKHDNIGPAIFLNVAFTVIEIIGGLWTNSLSILADALHDLGDSVALIAAWVLERRSRLPADARRTFGYRRLSLLAAFFSAGVLIAGSVYILSAAIPRLAAPQPVNAGGMIGLAVLGIAFNGWGFLRLKHGRSMNERMLAWHLLEDVLGWVVILLGGIVLRFWDVPILDPILTICFVSYTLWNVVKATREAFNIFLEGVPADVDLPRLNAEIAALDGVAGLHDVHIWSLEGATHLFTGQVSVATSDSGEIAQIRLRLRELLHAHGIEHSTIEIVPEGWPLDTSCALETPHYHGGHAPHKH